jgi:hypothetical protein
MSIGYDGDISFDVNDALGPSIRIDIRGIGDAAAGRIDASIEAHMADIAQLDLSDPAGHRRYMFATVSLLLTDIGKYEAALRSWARTRDEATRYGLAWVIAHAGVVAVEVPARSSRIPARDAGSSSRSKRTFEPPERSA